MSRVSVLAVDDSNAVLAYVRAVLAPHYTIETASTGHEALARLRESAPAIVLLDLSMPDLDGDEVLLEMLRDDSLRDIPVVIISSERERAHACLEAGAALYLEKPLRAETLRAAVAHVLSEREQKRQQLGLPVLFVGVGPLELGIPLGAVHKIVLRPHTEPLPTSAQNVMGMFDFHGSPVCVLDLAGALGVSHSEPIHEEKLVILHWGERLLALGVDRVKEPEVVPPENVTSADSLGGQGYPPLDVTRYAIRTPERLIPVIDPLAIFSQQTLDGLVNALQELDRASRAEAVAH